ncbi:hypothetical protein [Litorimonas haliclonae]|uniref:hypothetical protein n=1 Tax=Litorimonas haliclonae TaxID=2081977 RepID=UPI0039EEF013
MIGSQITGGLVAIVSLSALGMTSLGTFAGYKYGKSVEREKWETGVDEAEDRSEKGEAEIEAGADKVPAVIERETQTIVKTDYAAIRTIAELEGQVFQLKEDLKNAKNVDVCPGFIPDDWRVQHTQLDRLLFGGDEAGREERGESEPRLAGYPPAE